MVVALRDEFEECIRRRKEPEAGGVSRCAQAVQSHQPPLSLPLVVNASKCRIRVTGFKLYCVDGMRAGGRVVEFEDERVIFVFFFAVVVIIIIIVNNNIIIAYDDRLRKHL